jgi:hypothetical protein
VASLRTEAEAQRGATAALAAALTNLAANTYGAPEDAEAGAGVTAAGDAGEEATASGGGGGGGGQGVVDAIVAQLARGLSAQSLTGGAGAGGLARMPSLPPLAEGALDSDSDSDGSTLGAGSDGHVDALVVEQVDSHRSQDGGSAGASGGVDGAGVLQPHRSVRLPAQMPGARVDQEEKEPDDVTGGQSPVRIADAPPRAAGIDAASAVASSPAAASGGAQPLMHAVAPPSTAAPALAGDAASKPSRVHAAVVAPSPAVPALKLAAASSFHVHPAATTISAAPVQLLHVSSTPHAHAPTAVPVAAASAAPASAGAATAAPAPPHAPPAPAPQSNVVAAAPHLPSVPSSSHLLLPHREHGHGGVHAGLARMPSSRVMTARGDPTTSLAARIDALEATLGGTSPAALAASLGATVAASEALRTRVAALEVAQRSDGQLVGFIRSEVRSWLTGQDWDGVACGAVHGILAMLQQGLESVGTGSGGGGGGLGGIASLPHAPPLSARVARAAPPGRLPDGPTVADPGSSLVTPAVSLLVTCFAAEVSGAVRQGAAMMSVAAAAASNGPGGGDGGGAPDDGNVGGPAQAALYRGAVTRTVEALWSVWGGFASRRERERERAASDLLSSPGTSASGTPGGQWDGAGSPESRGEAVAEALHTALTGLRQLVSAPITTALPLVSQVGVAQRGIHVPAHSPLRASAARYRVPSCTQRAPRSLSRSSRQPSQSLTHARRRHMPGRSSA